MPTPTLVSQVNNPITGVFGNGFVQVFASSGTSWTVPDGVNNVRVRIFGAGGSQGAGGGGFGIKTIYNLAGSGITSVAVTVGTGGAGASATVFAPQPTSAITTAAIIHSIRILFSLLPIDFVGRHDRSGSRLFSTTCHDCQIRRGTSCLLIPDLEITKLAIGKWLGHRNTVALRRVQALTSSFHRHNLCPTISAYSNKRFHSRRRQ